MPKRYLNACGYFSKSSIQMKSVIQSTMLLIFDKALWFLACFLFLYIYLCRQSWWKQWLICKTNRKFKTKEVFHCLRAITALCFLFFLNGCQLPVAFVARKLVSTELKATFLLLLILWSQKWTKCILNLRINCQWCAYEWCKKTLSSTFSVEPPLKPQEQPNSCIISFWKIPLVYPL